MVARTALRQPAIIIFLIILGALAVPSAASASARFHVECPFHHFNGDDPILSLSQVVRRAATAAAGRRIYVVASDSPFLARLTKGITERLPPRYRRIEARRYRGGVIGVYEAHASPPG